MHSQKGNRVEFTGEMLKRQTPTHMEVHKNAHVAGIEVH